ncbi:hypothetical protein H206_05167 [Candidatus Electrothrix aarhusensis]|uniref:Uncharacterized protein n=1 Tax=Candidatus Electrothrix aarhusensis TaxID=1859131 RepID=A0A444J593_9BACT|nr:hypothetical protein H206_05167 [Candidatus Electrothrix aarhusensis]
MGLPRFVRNADPRSVHKRYGLGLWNVQLYLYGQFFATYKGCFRGELEVRGAFYPLFFCEMCAIPLRLSVAA